MSIKTLLIAGLTVGALSGVAAADPYDDGYGDPAPGTYENGYVWVAGAYEWINGAQVFVPAHWQLADPEPQPTVVVRTGWRIPRFEYRFEHRFERRDDRRDDRRFERREDRREDRGFDRRVDHRDGRTARSYRRGSRY